MFHSTLQHIVKCEQNIIALKYKSKNWLLGTFCTWSELLLPGRALHTCTHFHLHFCLFVWSWLIIEEKLQVSDITINNNHTCFLIFIILFKKNPIKVQWKWRCMINENVCMCAPINLSERMKNVHLQINLPYT